MLLYWYSCLCVLLVYFNKSMKKILDMRIHTRQRGGLCFFLSLALLFEVVSANGAVLIPLIEPLE